MKYDVFRETPTREVWACMGRGIEAPTGDAAVEQATAELPGHMLGAYFAVPSAQVEAFLIREHVSRSRTVEVARA